MRKGKLGVKILAAAAMLALVGSAFAALPPPGSNPACAGFKEHKIEFPPGGPIFNAPSSGLITSRVGELFTTPQGMQAVELIVLDFTDNGQAEGLGEFNFSLDNERDPGISWLQENPDGTLTQVMNIHMVGQAEALGGQILRTDKPANLTATLNKFPENGAVYTLTEPISMVDEKGNTVMVVHDVTVTMTDTHNF